MPKVPFWVFVVIAIIYFTAGRVDTMDIDASQYAEISREMLHSHDYLHLYDRGIEYLDKPPMLFWMSSAGMKLFGVNNFGYKFFSILFGLWAVFATYKLGKRLYDDTVGRMAALVLATCQGMWLMTNDIRTDTILMACVVTAIWLIQEYIVSCRLWYLLGGSAAIAMGMMTKGPIALFVPVFCFMTDWILKRQWCNFFRPAYLLGIIVIGILLLPMSIGLYQQFDMHPEKLVNGTHNVSGLRFFYWSQSIGRITGESPWNNGADISFLLLNMLWSFLPWIFLFLPALVLNIVDLVKQRFKLHPGQEWVTTGGFLLSYLSLGMSAYQLPHYIFVAFPLAAIVTAKLLWDIVGEHRYPRLLRIMQPVQAVIAFLLLGAVLALITWVFPASWVFLVFWAAGMGIWLYLAFKKTLHGKILWLSAAGMIIVNVFLTNHVYHTLLSYQVGSQAGRYIYAQHIPTKDITIYRVDDPLNSIQFYAQGSIRSIDTLLSYDTLTYVLTMAKGLKELERSGYNYNIQKQGTFFKVSELTGPFLNPATRSNELKEYYFVKVSRR